MNINNKDNIIWLLLDDRAGNCSQVLGIGKALKIKYIIKKIRYNKLSRFPNIVLQKTIKHIYENDRKQFIAPWPKIVIGCGRKSAPIGLWIKKQSNNYSKYIQIMWPSYPYKNIDMIFSDLHELTLLYNFIIETNDSLYPYVKNFAEKYCKKNEK